MGDKKIIKKSAIRGLVVALEVVEFLELSILLPAELYNSFLEDQQAAWTDWVYIGKLTAVRLTVYQASKDAVRRPISIDLSTASAVIQKLERYHLEAGPTAVVVFLEDLKKGYAEQKARSSAISGTTRCWTRLNSSRPICSASSISVPARRRR